MTDSRPTQDPLREVIPEAPAETTAGGARRILGATLTWTGIGAAMLAMCRTVISCRVIYSTAIAVDFADACSFTIRE